MNGLWKDERKSYEPMAEILAGSHEILLRAERRAVYGVPWT